MRKTAGLVLAGAFLAAACSAVGGRSVTGPQVAEDRSSDQAEQARAGWGVQLAADHSYDQIEAKRAALGAAGGTRGGSPARPHRTVPSKGLR